MSDDEVIRFEITDNDLDNEFNPFRGGRHKKEQQIYGVWAKDSDEDDNEDNIRRRTRKPKDYSAPIGFVAGGIQQAGKNDKQPDTQDEGSSMKPRFADSSDEEEPPQMPDESETAGIRRKGQGLKSATLGANLGTWEKHTRGIGAKLLLQMGYQPGKGLGKDLQGISAPIEATLRKGRGAIGAYGPEKDTIKAKKAEEKRAALKQKEEEPSKIKSNRWKKSHKGRYFYRDANDVIEEGAPSTHTASTSELSKVPVIDMTGREKRVLSGYHALRSAAPRFEHEPRRTLTNFSVPELSHNLQVSVECCEQDIIQNARKLHTTEDELTAFEKDIKECEKELREQDKAISTVENILNMIESLRRDNVSIDDVFQVLKKLKTAHPVEYETFELGTVAADILQPLLETCLSGWDPLVEPAKPLDIFTQAQIMLSNEGYNTLLWKHLVPHLRKAAELWNPRVPPAMLNTMHVWLQVLDAWTGKEVVNQVVVPRLASAVRAWSPTDDTLPIHQWLLPWHEMAGESLAIHVYGEVRSRLANALKGWHPADGSARPLLGVWANAWGPALSALLQTHIVPKLENCLKTAPIDLIGGENSAWLWCVDWFELLGANTLAGLATRSFLPRWLSALAAWLNTQPNHATVLRSYTDFKKMFPEAVAKWPTVAESFRKALDMINRACDLEVVAPPAPVISSASRSDRGRTVNDAIAMAQSAHSFTELLQQRCSENGISLIPLPGRMREGRPLYKIGNTLQCYVIRNVIMVTNDGLSFAPIALDSLIEMAR